MIGLVITAEVLNASTVVAGTEVERILVRVMTCPDIAQVEETDTVVT